MILTIRYFRLISKSAHAVSLSLSDEQVFMKELTRSLQLPRGLHGRDVAVDGRGRVLDEELDEGERVGRLRAPRQRRVVGDLRRAARVPRPSRQHQRVKGALQKVLAILLTTEQVIRRGNRYPQSRKMVRRSTTRPFEWIPYPHAVGQRVGGGAQLTEARHVGRAGIAEAPADEELASVRRQQPLQARGNGLLVANHGRAP